MKDKKNVLLLALALVLFVGGAAMLYGRLGDEIAPNLLATQGTSQPNSTEEPQKSEEPGGGEEPQESFRPAPDFTVYDRDGNPVKLSDFVGKPVVVNFWASWCGPCQMEMPDFEEKYRELGDEVQFLMVNVTDGSRETVESAAKFIEGKGYTFPVYYDIDVDAAAAYGVTGLPTTYFIGVRGEAVAYAKAAIDGDTLQKGIDMIFSPEGQ